MNVAALIQIFTFAWQGFWRNIWLSIVTITIIALALFSVNFLIILNVVTATAIDVIKNKVDVSLYFRPEITETQVLEAQTFLSALAQIETTTYISQQDALQAFRQRHQQDQTIIASLDELGDNPLGATLIVKAKQIEDYPEIISVVTNSKYNDLILDKNFADNQVYIEKIKNVSDNVNKIGFAAAGIFILIAGLIVFNTIRVAIYTHREEIGIMKLVGATNWFIRSPFIVESFFYAILGTVLAVAVVFPALNVVQPYIDAFFLAEGFSLRDYFMSHFLAIFGIELLITILLNVSSSSIAIRRYLRV